MKGDASMNKEQLERIQSGKGFIAALDQSGGSTPKALRNYGINEDQYSTDEEMFDLVHEMRTRIIKSPAFNSDHILGAILFENTMERKIDAQYTADYLWEKKGIVPFLKVDKGLAELEDGVQLMKPIDNLDDLLKRANEHRIFGTKMRSVIKEANPVGIKKIVAQQFEVAKEIIEAGLVPIIEPEIDIYSRDKAESEKIMKEEFFKHLAELDTEAKVMFKISLPTEDNFFNELLEDPRVIRIVALSGGYSREEANEILARNEGIIASFSRALTEGLNVNQTDEEFNATLEKAVQDIYEASIK